MHTIKHICEPEKLFLCWQTPIGRKRSRYVIAELRKKENEYFFRYLNDTVDFDEAKKQGFTIYPAFRDIDKKYTVGVIEAFSRRIPPRSRSDFREYLKNFRLPDDVQISDFALLGYSGAKLPSDGFSIVNSLEDVCVPSEFLIELAGTRYIKGLDLSFIEVGMQVEVVAEPENPHDEKAIYVVANCKKIGYINRVQTAGFHQWMREGKICFEATIERTNGSKERPIVYLFLQIFRPLKPGHLPLF